jgi:hypothetical protein
MSMQGPGGEQEPQRPAEDMPGQSEPTPDEPGSSPEELRMPQESPAESPDEQSSGS